VKNEAVTPADSTSAAYCHVWDFGPLGWQLSNKYYTDCRNAWKGRDAPGRNTPASNIQELRPQ
jgi:hypothetical protein